MAIAFDAGSVGDTASGTSLTFSHTCSGLNRILALTIATWRATPTPAPTVTATYNGVAVDTLSSTLPFNFASSFARITMLALKAPTTGANNVVITASATCEIIASSVSYTGVDQTTPFGTPSSTSVGVGTGSITQNISSAVGDLVIDGLIGYDMGTETPGANQTSRAPNDNTTVTNSTFMSEEAGVATTTMSWSWTGTSEAAAQIAVNMNAAGASAALSGTVTASITEADIV